MPSMKVPVPQLRSKKAVLRGQTYRFRELTGQAYRDLVAANSTTNADGSQTVNEEALFDALALASLLEPTVTPEQLKAFPNGLQQSIQSAAIRTSVVRDVAKVISSGSEVLAPGEPPSRVEVLEFRGIQYRLVEASADDNTSLQDKFTHPNAFGVEVTDLEPYHTALAARCIETPRMNVPQLLALPNALLMTLVERVRDLNKVLDDLQLEDDDEGGLSDDSPSPDA